VALIINGSRSIERQNYSITGSCKCRSKLLNWLVRLNSTTVGKRKGTLRCQVSKYTRKTNLWEVSRDCCQRWRSLAVQTSWCSTVSRRSSSPDDSSTLTSLFWANHCLTTRSSQATSSHEESTWSSKVQHARSIHKHAFFRANSAERPSMSTWRAITTQSTLW
jgi:hypothetical protein